MLTDVLKADEMLEKIEEFFKQRGGDETAFFANLQQETSKLQDNNVFHEKFALHDVSGIFKFEEEAVCVKDFENGARQDLGNNLLSSMISVGRNFQTINLIENFDFEKFKQSIIKDPIRLLEINGKYYLEDGGNHRMMALKFLYFLEMAKPGANEQEINKKFTFNFPVKHLNHSADLIESALQIMQHKRKSKFPKSYFAKTEAEIASLDSILSFNKETNTYNVHFEGRLKQNLTEADTLTYLSKLQSYDKPYLIHSTPDGFGLEFGNMLTLGLTKEQLIEEINLLNLYQKTFPAEFSVVKKNENQYDLFIQGKRFHGSQESVIKMYSGIIQANKNPELEVENFKIMTKEEVQKNFLSNLDFADIHLTENGSFVEVFGKIMENLNKEELAKAINHLKKERCFCPRETITIENAKTKEKKEIIQEIK